MNILTIICISDLRVSSLKQLETVDFLPVQFLPSHGTGSVTDASPKPKTVELPIAFVGIT